MRRILHMLALLALCGCAAQGNPAVSAPVANETGTQFGVTLSPKGFGASDFTAFFPKATEAGTIVSLAGDWNDAGKEGGAPSVVAALAPTYNYTSIIELQFFSQKDGKLLRPLDEATKQQYKKIAADFAARHKPKYMAIGIEVNVLYEKSPIEFEQFVSFYPEVYDAVKAASPKTDVFPVFQLEKMVGMGGGLFGGENGATEWALLEKFPKSDLVAFTTYPDLVYWDPSEIPADYYSEIKMHTSKKIAFTEIGWHSAASPAGWESSEAEQSEFVSIFFNRTSSLDEEFAIWSFLYDQNAPEPFGSMGLIRSNGAEKQAWNSWIAQRHGQGK